MEFLKPLSSAVAGARTESLGKLKTQAARTAARETANGSPKGEMSGSERVNEQLKVGPKGVERPKGQRIRIERVK
jgi:hypothetical protein